MNVELLNTGGGGQALPEESGCWKTICVAATFSFFLYLQEQSKNVLRYLTTSPATSGTLAPLTLIPWIIVWLDRLIKTPNLLPVRPRPIERIKDPFGVLPSDIVKEECPRFWNRIKTVVDAKDDIIE